MGRRWTVGLALGLVLACLAGCGQPAPINVSLKNQTASKSTAASKRSDISTLLRQAMGQSDFLLQEAKGADAAGQLRRYEQALDVVEDALYEVGDRAEHLDLGTLLERTYAKKVGELAGAALWKIDTVRDEQSPHAQTVEAKLDLTMRLHQVGYDALTEIQRETDTKSSAR